MLGRDIQRLTWLMAMQVAVSLASAVEVDFEKLDFDKRVAPILAGRCIECHSGAEAKGKLDLTSAEKALAGGESGIAIVAGSPIAAIFGNGSKRMRCRRSIRCRRANEPF